MNDPEMRAWEAEDTVPQVQAASSGRKILRLLRFIRLVAGRVQRLEERVTALEQGPEMTVTPRDPEAPYGP